MILIAGFIAWLVLDPPWAWIALAGAFAIEAAEVYAWILYLRRFRVRTGAEGLIGETAEAIEPCDPTGRVKRLGEIWRAECVAGAAAGERVRITAVRGLTLIVEPDDRSPGA